MKLLKLDSGLAARKQLAQELGYSGALDGSAEMNVWLHKQVMTNYKAPPDERGGNGYVQPTATATHLDSTQPAHRRHRRCPDPGRVQVARHRDRTSGWVPVSGGGLQGYLNLKGYWDFAAQNRADGWNVWLTFSISPAEPSARPPRSELSRPIGRES
jgi:hypothetical protein